MATASKFTKVSVIQSLSLEEADALIAFMELVSQKSLSIAQQTMVTGIYQSLKKAAQNG